MNVTILLRILPDLGAKYSLLVDGERLGDMETLNDAIVVRDYLTSNPGRRYQRQSIPVETPVGSLCLLRRHARVLVPPQKWRPVENCPMPGPQGFTVPSKVDVLRQFISNRPLSTPNAAGHQW